MRCHEYVKLIRFRYQKKSVFIFQKNICFCFHIASFYFLSPRSAAAPPHIPPASTTVWSGRGWAYFEEKRRLEIECVPRFSPLAIPQARSLRKEEIVFSILIQPGLEPGSFTAFALLERYSRLPTEMEQNFNYLLYMICLHFLISN